MPRSLDRLIGLSVAVSMESLDGTRQEAACGRRRIAGRGCGARCPGVARQALDRLRLGDTIFRLLTRAAAMGVLIILGGVIAVALPRLAAGVAGIRLQLPDRAALESGDREVRRAGADLRHDRHLSHCHADRGAGRPHDRVLSYRAVPAMAAAADRNCDRAARRHPQHHLRHLGPVRVRAVPAGDAAAVPDRDPWQRPGPVGRCSRDRPTGSAC